jgi:adenylate kinase family enzyme
MLYKFYRIKSDKGNKVYIGSTIRDLEERMKSHISNRDCSSTILFDEYGVEHCSIELINEINFETKQEAHREEGRLIKETGNNAVNKCIPGRNKKQYYEENKEYHKEKNKQWREENNEYYKKIGKKYHEKNKEKHNAYHKEWYEKNKQLINAKRKTEYKNKKLILQQSDLFLQLNLLI